MNYVRIGIYVVIAVNLCSPVWAGNGNALAGGWNGELSGGGLRLSPATAPANHGSPSSAPAFDSGSSSGSLFDFGSGGSSSHSSGGAPSPEVNAILGLMLAGSTVAFLRRRKSGTAKSAA